MDLKHLLKHAKKVENVDKAVLQESAEIAAKAGSNSQKNLLRLHGRQSSSNYWDKVMCDKGGFLIA